MPANTSSSLDDYGNQTYTSNCSLGPNNWTFTVVPVYVMSISVLGVALNLFVLTVFILHKKPCSVPEIYLSNLAAADLLLVSLLPFWAVSAWKKFEWIFGLALCKMVNVSILMNVYCSIYFLVLVSLDRYLAVVHPLSYEKLRRPKLAKICCLLVWILGFLLSVPRLVNRDLVRHGNVTKCHEADRTLFFTTEGMISVLGFFIPILLIVFCTFNILKALRSRFMAQTKTKTKKKDYKATILVLAVLLAFLVCWIPFHLLKIPNLLFEAGFLKGCAAETIIIICGQIFTNLAFFNSVLNPILYTIAGTNFRDKLMELFTQLEQKRSSTVSLTSASTRIFRSLRSPQNVITN